MYLMMDMTKKKQGKDARENRGFHLTSAWAAGSHIVNRELGTAVRGTVSSEFLERHQGNAANRTKEVMVRDLSD